MVKEIVQHGHCHNCGRAVKYGQKTCSEACQQAFEQAQKSRKRNMWIMYALFIVIFVFLVVVPALFGGGQ